ncbi:MAG: coenzyme F420-0:L-glutamate ligase [Gammaproteobacteria bacterium]|nr:coenzyme F420-0:L-glutamate ligase [Gammaproteobacteria bacterium]
MKITTIKTHKIKPKESISDILDTYITKLTENSIVAIASKIIGISENRLVSKNKNKINLIKKESDFCFEPPKKQPNFYLTLKDHRLIPNAGIDESNCDDSYVLLPKKPQLTAKKIWEHLRQKHQIKNLGVIITDSNITPLRLGVTGITIGWCGFNPIYNYVGQKDVFGEDLKVTQINLLDSLATTATLVTGEGNEQTPIVIMTQLPDKINFKNKAPTKKEERSIYITPKDDLFSTVISYE